MSRSKSPSQGESSARRARAPERRPGAKRTIRSPRRVNLVFEADQHSDLIRFLGWRQNREGVEISMGRALMQALRESALFKEWEEENPKKPGGEK
jgi:hypothetical protein